MVAVEVLQVVGEPGRLVLVETVRPVRPPVRDGLDARLQLPRDETREVALEVPVEGVQEGGAVGVRVLALVAIVMDRQAFGQAVVPVGLETGPPALLPPEGGLLGLRPGPVSPCLEAQVAQGRRPHIRDTVELGHGQDRPAVPSGLVAVERPRLVKVAVIAVENIHVEVQEVGVGLGPARQVDRRQPRP